MEDRDPLHAYRRHGQISEKTDGDAMRVQFQFQCPVDLSFQCVGIGRVATVVYGTLHKILPVKIHPGPGQW